MRMEVQNHQEEWLQMYEEEARKLKGVYGDNLVDIHHIGSTSVLGLNPKPIIDIMPVLGDIEKVDRFNGEMGGLEYETLGGIWHRRQTLVQKRAVHKGPSYPHLPDGQQSRHQSSFGGEGV